MIRTVALILASISFIVVIGGAVYEHLAVVPVWSAAVPASLAMYQGEYRLAAENFWIPIHPVAIVLLTIALLLNWKTARRYYVLATLLGYAAVLLTTFIYFVPELMSLTQTAYSTTVNSELTGRAQTWEILSLVRLGFLICTAVILLLGLSKNETAAVEGFK
ncbi:MAG: hypothetical protein QUS14_09510 [Pyrinomonadaceae bacterium]|nr:hypothetical protein [Pyrinomonadaceae bacterium]